ncbi:Endonuclease-reverse transcriptase, partial [Operophtera brumata]
ESAKYWESKLTESLSTTVNIQQQYNKLEGVLKLLLNELPRSKEEEKVFINQETNDLLEKRRLLYKRKRTKEIQLEITKISKLINRNISNEKKGKRQEILEKFISKTGALRKAYKELSEKSKWATNMKNKRGKMLSRRPDIIKEATNFYKELYKKETSSGLRNFELDRDSTSADTGFQAILKSEIRHAIRTQKNNKAPGTGASIYVCGDFNGFKNSIKVTLQTCLVNDGKTEDEAQSLICGMEKDRRFVFDIWA